MKFIYLDPPSELDNEELLFDIPFKFIEEKKCTDVRDLVSIELHVKFIFGLISQNLIQFEFDKDKLIQSLENLKKMSYNMILKKLDRDGIPRRIG